MQSLLRLFAVSVLFFGVSSSQARAQEEEQPLSLVSIYRIAPGQHIAFLQWMADQEAAARDASAPAGQWYVHVNGDAWDFLQIAADLSDEQGDAVDAAAEARGLKTGPPSGIEFRQYVAWHTDTFVAGPMTAAELLSRAQGE